MSLFGCAVKTNKQTNTSCSVSDKVAAQQNTLAVSTITTSVGKSTRTEIFEMDQHWKMQLGDSPDEGLRFVVVYKHWVNQPCLYRKSNVKPAFVD